MAERRGLLLELVQRAGVRERCLVDRHPFVIGRGRTCELPLSADSISRRHLSIARTPGGWVAVELAASGGTFVNEQRMSGDHVLQVGAVITVGSARLRVLALDHVAAPGELTGPMVRTVTFACPAIGCRAEVELRSATSDAGLAAELDALAAGADTHVDPVAMLLSARELTLLRKSVGRIALRTELSGALFDDSALALLRDNADPARAAWRWLLGRSPFDGLVEPPAQLLGLEAGWRDQIIRPLPRELAAIRPPPGPGVLLWIQNRMLGQLVWVDRAMRVAPAEPPPTVSQSFAIEVTPIGATWKLTPLLGELAPNTLSVGGTVTLWYTAITPLAIR